MKTSCLSRMALAVIAVVVASLSAGCHSPQSSASAPIRPNWYDSYYYKDGHLIVPEVPNTAPVAGVWAE